MRLGELTREQAADYLCVSKRTMDKWAQNGVGPSYRRRGRRTYYRLEDLDDWSNAYQLKEMRNA